MGEVRELNLNRFDLVMLDIRLNHEDMQNTEGIDLLKAIKVERAGLEKKVEFLERELNKYEPREIIGEDPEINRIINMIDIVAEDAHISVLIRDETGTGKELVARAALFADHDNHKKIIPSDLPYEIHTGQAEISNGYEVEIPESGVNVEEKLAKLELAYIEEALKNAVAKKQRRGNYLDTMTGSH